MQSVELNTTVIRVENDMDWLNLLKDLKNAWVCDVKEDTYSPDYLFTQVKKGENMEDNGIIVDPDYQRKFRFTDEKASSIIESLILKIPIPTIYLASENHYDSQKGQYKPVRRVIDGQHRIKSIYRFMNNEYCLKNLEILKPLEGLYYNDFPKTLKAYFDSQTDLEVATVDVNDNKYLELEVFSRFNEETNPLSKQELYNAIYNSHYVNIFKREMPALIKSNSFWWEQFNFSQNVIEKSMHIYNMYIIPAYYRLDNFKKSDTPYFVREYMKDVYYLDEEAALVRIEEDKNLYIEFFKFIENLAKANGIKYMFSKNILDPTTKEVPSRHRYLVSILIQLVFIFKEIKKIGLLDIINDYEGLYLTIREGFRESDFGNFNGRSSTAYSYQMETLRKVVEAINIVYADQLSEIYEEMQASNTSKQLELDL
ncbi:DUF262 domain-containing protein [Clostridium perfringens]|uniref:DUF262 domain-containing protein n=1 Tax=Clostridium perfringens TaxID=1502 RepID=UPI001FBA41F5|nr:DUF262 domain-containing protein [Clostridium perfringens]MCX0361409.1 DUF262 domain-containing protein [Clostridium perfringens]